MNALTDQLANALASFDGKALTLLSESKARFGHDPGYLTALIDLAKADEPNTASGATWLIKDHLETGGKLCDEEAAAFLSIMPALVGWQAQLHACQSLQFLTLNESQRVVAAELARWLDGLTASDCPFLRAWSVDGLTRIALQFPAHQQVAKSAIDRALSDDAASVRARARKLEALWKDQPAPKG